MKKSMLAAFTAAQFAMASSPAQPINEQHIAGLLDARHFALGHVGFVGHISQAEQHYRAVLQSADALVTFLRMLNSTDTSVEARLYAACGIRQLAPDEFEPLTRALEESGASASVLRTDILQKEPVSLLLHRIKRFGCESTSPELPDTPPH